MSSAIISGDRLVDQRNETRQAQIGNVREHLASCDIEVHRIPTELGTVYVTFEGLGEHNNPTGSVWASDPITVNRVDHELLGRYRLTYHYEHQPNTGGTITGDYLPNPDRPRVWVDGYPGLRRLDGGTITDNARGKIEDALGRAIVAHRRGTDWSLEALVNARALAADKLTRDARYARDTAARYIADAEKLEARAHAILHDGADYSDVKV
jgi:hypothetical protein